MKALALVLLLTAGAWSQTLGYGIKAGVPFTEAFSVGAAGQTSHFVIGPMFELRVTSSGSKSTRSLSLHFLHAELWQRRFTGGHQTQRQSMAVPDRRQGAPAHHANPKTVW